MDIARKAGPAGGKRDEKESRWARRQVRSRKTASRVEVPATQEAARRTESQDYRATQRRRRARISTDTYTQHHVTQPCEPRSGQQMIHALLSLTSLMIMRTPEGRVRRSVGSARAEATWSRRSLAWAARRTRGWRRLDHGRRAHLGLYGRRANGEWRFVPWVGRCGPTAW